MIRDERKKFFGQCCFVLGPGRSNIGFGSVTDSIISEPTPSFQVVRCPWVRWFRVLSGSVIVETDTPVRNWTLNAATHDELLIEPGVQTLMKNAAGWQPSRLQVLHTEWAWERFLQAHAADKAGGTIDPELLRIAKDEYGFEARIIEHHTAKISKYIIPRQAIANI